MVRAHLRWPLTYALVWIAAGASLERAAAAPQAWLTGPAVDEQLKSVASVSWSNTPMSQALASLRNAQRIAIVLDRRVDPERKIQLDLPREPLSDIFRKIAQQSQLGYCQLGPVAYFGPRESARRLRTLAALRTQEAQSIAIAIAKASPAARKLLTRQSSRWEDLAEPRKIVQGWAADAGVELAGAERIGHDLWAAADLPPLTWIDRVTLIAAQFDLTFRIDPGGAQVELVPMPAKVALARTYRVGAGAESAAKRWSAELPDAVIAAAGEQVRMEGLLEDHEFIARKLRGTAPRRTTVTAGKEVYQVSIENAPLARVSRQLAERLGLEFKWDRAAIEQAGISTDQLVSIRVENADIDELLRSLFKGTGLTFERADRTVTIRPAGAPSRGR